ncbi:MAG TPA: hypothetical protein VLA03_07640 [Draconibacterium sp.]|nr:hypothetical protein [Draconibacterium sp.]
MKTTVKQLAAATLIALLLVIGNVNAEGTETKALIRESIETTLQLENWMTNEAVWNKNAFNFGEYFQETESNLQIENWMTSDKTWSSNKSFVEETETSLELECWMTCEKIWNGNNNVEKTETETELTVENWMTNENIWNR